MKVNLAKLLILLMASGALPVIAMPALTPAISQYSAIKPTPFSTGFQVLNTQGSTPYAVDLCDGCGSDWRSVPLNTGSNSVPITAAGPYTIAVWVTEKNYGCQWTNVLNRVLITRANGNTVASPEYQNFFNGGSGSCNNNDWQDLRFSYIATLGVGDQVTVQIRYGGGGGHSAALLNKGGMTITPAW